MKERVLLPGARSGSVRIPSSKSEVQRLVLAAALSEGETKIRLRGISEDIEAAVGCLKALCAEIGLNEDREGAVLTVCKIRAEIGENSRVLLPCRESAAVLRFLLPVAGAFGIPAVFRREGSLKDRPMGPYLAELARHGMTFSEDGEDLLALGRLNPGRYELPGNLSSQFVSGLLFALPLLNGESFLFVSGPVESAAYVRMTERVLAESGIVFEKQLPGAAEGELNAGLVYRIPGGQRYRLPGEVTAGGDWSGAALFLAMGALSESGVRVEGLSEKTDQGDRQMLGSLRAFGAKVAEDETGVTVSKGKLKGCVIDGKDIPDLVPPLAVLAGLAEGETVLMNAGRLRFKESDRLKTTAALIRALGGQCIETPDGLLIRGVSAYSGGAVLSFRDHRIAMCAALAAAGAKGPVTLRDPDAVRKSFPDFFERYDALERESK